MTRLADRAAVRVGGPRSVERKLKVTVLSGGPSSEREVSLKSGQAVTRALQSLGHTVHCADVTPDHLEALDRKVDLVFIALHGAFGEDGRIQKILEDRGLVYCGCGPEASALAMDKTAAKCRFMEHEVPTPPFELATAENFERIGQTRALPAVVKPCCEGSSIDCTLIHDRRQLQTVLRSMVEDYGCCLVEQFIDGLELTVGILGDEALPPIQIRTKREFYNYEAKYQDDGTEYLFDTDLPPEVIEQVKALSVRAHQALGCRDFSRVDWMVDRATLQPYALEVNTIPGFTDHSLLPKAAAKAGLSFAALCQRIIDLTLSR